MTWARIGLAAAKQNGVRDAMTNDLRPRIENTIEFLISLLDEIDGDADHKPSMGWTHNEARFGCGLQPRWMTWNRAWARQSEDGSSERWRCVWRRVAT